MNQWDRKRKDERPTVPPIVRYVPVRCPFCKSRECTNNGRRGRIGWHECRVCGIRFKSLLDA